MQQNRKLQNEDSNDIKKNPPQYLRNAVTAVAAVHNGNIY